MHESSRFLSGELSRRLFIKGSVGTIAEMVGFSDDSSTESAEVVKPIYSNRFFRGPGSHLTLGGTHKLSQSVEGNIVSYIRWGDKTSYEQYEMNDNGVYLKLDRSNAPQKPYRFYPGKWMNRVTHVGDVVDMTANTIQWYSQACEPIAENAPQPKSGWFPYTTRVLAMHDRYDTGGSLGSMPALELEYDLRGQGGNFEHFVYGEDVGLIRWSEHDGKTGRELLQSTFNKLMGGTIDPEMSVACQ